MWASVFVLSLFFFLSEFIYSHTLTVDGREILFHIWDVPNSQVRGLHSSLVFTPRMKTQPLLKAAPTGWEPQLHKALASGSLSRWFVGSESFLPAEYRAAVLFVEIVIAARSFLTGEDSEALILCLWTEHKVLMQWECPTEDPTLLLPVPIPICMGRAAALTPVSLSGHLCTAHCHSCPDGLRISAPCTSRLAWREGAG